MSDEEGVTMSKVRRIALAVTQKSVFRRRIRDSVARRRAPVARLVVAFAALLGMTLLPLAVATATGDTTPPTLTSFSFSPTTVDTSASAQTISITVHLSDDVAGVQYGEYSFAGPSNQYLNSQPHPPPPPPLPPSPLPLLPSPPPPSPPPSLCSSTRATGHQGRR